MGKEDDTGDSELRDSVEAMVTEDRKFLHDLSNKILVASGVSSYILKEVQDFGDSPLEAKWSKYLDKFEKMARVMDDSIQLIRDHKAKVILFSENLEKKKSS